MSETEKGKLEDELELAPETVEDLDATDATDAMGAGRMLEGTTGIECA